MNLTGHWKGNYTYGNGYPKSLVGKSEPFEFELIDNEGNITGTCIDEIVKAKAGNQSKIVGSFSGNFISFLKTYKYHFAIEEQDNLVPQENMVSDGVNYVGSLKKRFLSKKLYFIGEWQIDCVYKNVFGILHQYSLGGIWTMRKM